MRDTGANLDAIGEAIAPTGRHPSPVKFLHSANASSVRLSPPRMTDGMRMQGYPSSPGTKTSATYTGGLAGGGGGGSLKTWNGHRVASTDQRKHTDGTRHAACGVRHTANGTAGRRCRSKKTTTGGAGNVREKTPEMMSKRPMTRPYAQCATTSASSGREQYWVHPGRL